MAWSFDESSGQHITVGDNAVLTFPDGDWSLGGWVKLDDNAGSAFQYFFSWGIVNSQSSLNWLYHESGAVGPGELQALMGDDDTTLLDVQSTGAPATTDWQHVLLVRSGLGTIRQYINGVEDGVDTSSAFDAINGSSLLYLGMRGDNDADRRLGGAMAEWAKWDRTLFIAERNALAAGWSPSFFKPAWHIPMIRPYQEVNNALTVTNNSSTVSAHPPMIYPPAPYMGFSVAAEAVPGGIVVLRRRRS